MAPAAAQEHGADFPAPPAAGALQLGPALEAPRQVPGAAAVVLASGGSLTASTDSDCDVCVLLPDPSGDVHRVCESDPTHPVSLAERAVLRPIVPASLLQDIEAKLEADLATVGVSVLFAVGFISLEFGVTDLIEVEYGDSVMTDVACVLVGLMTVLWVRLTGVKPMRLWHASKEDNVRQGRR